MINADFEPSLAVYVYCLTCERVLYDKAWLGKAWKGKTAWNYMDYAEQVKNVQLVGRFTYYEYLKLKRKPPKAETKTETETGA